MLTNEQMHELALTLDQAEQTARPIKPFEAQMPLDSKDAYAIQLKRVAQRKHNQEKIVGLKMGLTSAAKMEQMGVKHPIVGHLTDKMALSTSNAISLKGLIHPKIEPELVFYLKAPIHRPIDFEECDQFIKYVGIGFEIIDSRYENFKFTLNEVICDNTSACRYVLGEQRFLLNSVDLSNLGVVLEKNNDVIHTASTSAVLDHPLNAVVQLSHLLEHIGGSIAAEQFIFSGAITPAVTISKMDSFKVKFQKLGNLSCCFE